MDLMRKLPDGVYGGERHVDDLQQAVDAGLEEAREAKEDLFRQLRPSSATWGMDRFEREYGILTDRDKSLALRRAELRARRRGRGTTTLGVVRKVAESYSAGKVEVWEVPEDYRFLIRFDLFHERQPRLEQLRAVLSEIKPAHLDYEIVAERSLAASLYVKAHATGYRSLCLNTPGDLWGAGAEGEEV